VSRSNTVSTSRQNVAVRPRVPGRGRSPHTVPDDHADRTSEGRTMTDTRATEAAEAVKAVG
jgi:hypothetical protein